MYRLYFIVFSWNSLAIFVRQSSVCFICIFDFRLIIYQDGYNSDILLATLGPFSVDLYAFPFWMCPNVANTYYFKFNIISF